MKPIRVLLADDSPTARAMLRALLEGAPDMQVVGVAENGSEAVEMTESLEPDVVLMDVHMPELDGIAATREIMSRRPTPIVIVSAVSQRDVDLSLEATEAGALVALPKPDGPQSPRFADQVAQLLSMVRAMAGVKVVRRWSVDRPRPRPVIRPRSRPIRIAALAASTGGPPALRMVLSQLPKGFGVPIVVVQHIARDFTAGLAHWLDEGTTLRVSLARRGEILEPGHVYLAPDDVHLGVTRDGTATWSSAPPLHGFRPSATHLFMSVAECYGSAGLGVVLTGMGADGAEGLAALHDAGGHVIGQDEASSVVFGMAQEAQRRGAVDEMLPIDRIAPRMLALVQREAA